MVMFVATLVAALLSSIGTVNSNPIKKIEGLIYLGTLKTGRTAITTGSDYYYSRALLTWGAARAFCLTQTEGNLLSIESNAENDFIHNQLTNLDTPVVWTSGAFDTLSKVWRWSSTGEAFGTTNWRQANPKEPLTNSTSYRCAFESDMSFNSHWLVRPSAEATYFICEIPTTPKPVPCFEKNDLVMLLDGSGSIGSIDFIVAKDFVALLASAFQRPDQRLSLIIFGTNSNVIFGLDNTLTSVEIDAAIKGAPYPNAGGTATNLGIDAAVVQLKTSLPHVPRKMVVFTDGDSNNSELTALAAAYAHANGVVAYSVGIGNFNTAELLTIAGGNANHVFTTSNFNSLIRLIAPLSSSVCEN